MTVIVMDGKTRKVVDENRISIILDHILPMFGLFTIATCLVLFLLGASNDVYLASYIGGLCCCEGSAIFLSRSGKMTFLSRPFGGIFCFLRRKHVWKVRTRFNYLHEDQLWCQTCHNVIYVESD